MCCVKGDEATLALGKHLHLGQNILKNIKHLQKQRLFETLDLRNDLGYGIVPSKICGKDALRIALGATATTQALLVLY